MPRCLDAQNYPTDKSQTYLRNYERHFGGLCDQEIRLLELGVREGGSLLMWRDYFVKGLIAGLDVEPSEIPDGSGRVFIYRGRQEDRTLLDKIATERAPNGFDVIIDGCSHIGELTKISFWHLFDNHLKPGGIYVIEDWRVGYYGKWPDGATYRPAPERHPASGLLDRIFRRKRTFPSHSYGMVGFVKELIDELGTDMITFSGRGATGPQRYPRFRAMEVTPGQVFIAKATAEDTELLRAALKA